MAHVLVVSRAVQAHSMVHDQVVGSTAHVLVAASMAHQVVRVPPRAPLATLAPLHVQAAAVAATRDQAVVPALAVVDPADQAVVPALAVVVPVDQAVLVAVVLVLAALAVDAQVVFQARVDAQAHVADAQVGVAVVPSFQCLAVARQHRSPR
jgi:hypothetical protein